MEETPEDGAILLLVNNDEFPNDSIKWIPIEFPGLTLEALGTIDRNYLYLTYSGKTKVVHNTTSFFASLFMADTTFVRNTVNTDQWAARVWPKLEYR